MNYLIPLHWNHPIQCAIISSTLTDQMEVRTDALETALIELQDVKDIVAQSYQIRDTVLTIMQELRIACQEAETVTAKKYWPFPSYGDLLFSVK